MNSLVTPLRDDEGSLLGFGKVMRNRTQYQQMGNALLGSEAQFRALADNISHLV